MSLAKRDSLWFGLTCVVLALSIGSYCYVRSTRSFAQARAIITAVEMGAPGDEVSAGSQRVLYHYSVAGTEYRGQGLAPVVGTAGSALRAGGTIPIYFETASPGISYAFSPPRPLACIIGTLIFTLFGLAAIIAGWPH